MHPTDPIAAVQSIPAGAWAVGVSGGIDSVALLELARQRSDLQLHVAHLDHETRAGGSAQDAKFVADLASRWNIPVTIARRRDIRFSTSASSPAARFRAARLAFFKYVVDQHGLQGLLLAHHADDQAETVLHRLLRGSGPAGLGGMPMETTIGPLRVRRPLLGVAKAALRALLNQRSIPWREDASNALPNQQRNRLRQVLAANPELSDRLIELADACRMMMSTLRDLSPPLPGEFEVSQLCDLPPPLARESARRWLSERAGVDVEITPAAIERLVQMAADAASSARQHFPGKVLVRRKSGRISASAPARSPAKSQLPPRAGGA